MCECELQSDRTLWSHVHFTGVLYECCSQCTAFLRCSTLFVVLNSFYGSSTETVSCLTQWTKKCFCVSLSVIRIPWRASRTGIHYKLCSFTHFQLDSELGSADFRSSWHITGGVWHIGNSCFPERLAHSREHKITALQPVRQCSASATV